MGKNFYNIEQLRKQARKNLPDPMFHYMEGGADDEVSLERNCKAFDRYQITPKSLRDISNLSTETEVLGHKSPLPLILAPTGMNRLFHHHKEYAVAKAAEKQNLIYSLSTVATTSIEAISNTISSPKMMQVYIHKDRELTRTLVERTKKAGYSALCLTVDTVVAGNRERDFETGMGLPPKFTLKSIASFLLHSYWLRHAFINKGFTLSNLTDYINKDEMSGMSPAEYINNQFDRTLSWKDLEWLRNHWDGKLVIKGVQNAHDAKTAETIGADAIMISNHGGRQLDGSPAPIDSLKPIKEAINGQTQLIVDGGIRRGSDIFKAIALGADAVSIGRPYLYGLAALGEEGVISAISILKEEFERTMMLSGCSSLADIKEDMITPY
ncbi:alpha-hydroxy acid oxidase [Temperatibacter marinus]|uniref:Alpha-hydroxy acid oxidase n=1 Tax=Temperatibacter marinus TaxID=1456591 RepID=A0AA52H8V1_9PROT|nr:alpha-hydroxy acid oxidase [Temperatibacter marinus]WND02496.1 alpha-hydroxy acid oxidase [Temperatibacter marinus]